MKHLLTVVLSLSLFVSLLLSPLANSQSPVDPGKAHAAAQAWLSLTDKGDYGQSWDESGLIFREAMAKAKWSSMLTTTRSPLGSVQTREFRSAEFSRTLPGAADGLYMLVQYNTRFEQGPPTLESVTLSFEGSDWKMIGYFIQAKP